MELNVKQHTYCVVVNIGLDDIHAFLAACTERYGTPKDQKFHGMKFSRPYVGPEEGSHPLGMIHVTVYLTTGNVMVQGPSFLLWHAEMLPKLLEGMAEIAKTKCINNTEQNEAESEEQKSGNGQVVKRQPRPHEKRKSKPETTETETFSCSVCDASDSHDMLLCDACETWLHYTCSKISPEPALRKLTKVKKSVCICWKCETPNPTRSQIQATDESEIAVTNMSMLTQSFEKNIMESLQLMTGEKQNLLNWNCWGNATKMKSLLWKTRWNR